MKTRTTRSFSAREAARWSKVLLLAAMALFFTLVVLNNTTDFDSNFEFVHHVLSMDTTLPGNHGLWRALHSRGFDLAFYLSIITWEALNMVLCWTGAGALLRACASPAEVYLRAKRVGIVALTAGLLLWLVGFVTIGGEWFLMWQSASWNGQEAAFRMFTVEALILVLLVMPEPDA